jgi:predicted metal-binding transcription factor (methanogenesis marker protein 9)
MQRNPQELMRNGAMVMENPSRKGLASDLPSPKQIKLFSLQQCHVCRKPPNMCPVFTIPPEMDLKLSRMVRVESFTTLTKLGSGTEGYFTSLLISRVCLLKTLKTFKLQSSKMLSEK